MSINIASNERLFTIKWASCNGHKINDNSQIPHIATFNLILNKHNSYKITITLPMIEGRTEKRTTDRSVPWGEGDGQGTASLQCCRARNKRMETTIVALAETRNFNGKLLYSNKRINKNIYFIQRWQLHIGKQAETPTKVIPMPTRSHLWRVILRPKTRPGQREKNIAVATCGPYKPTI